MPTVASARLRLARQATDDECDGGSPMTTISPDLGDALGPVRSTPRRRRWAKLGRDDQARRNSNEGCQTNRDKGD